MPSVRNVDPSRGLVTVPVYRMDTDGKRVHDSEVCLAGIWEEVGLLVLIVVWSLKLATCRLLWKIKKLQRWNLNRYSK